MEIDMKLWERVSKDSKMFRRMLDLVLSDSEEKAIAQRIKIMGMLLKDKETQRAIADKIGVGIATVERCSKALKSIGDDNLKRMIKDMS